MRFLLVAPQSFGLYKLIVSSLESMGFDVVHIENYGYSDFKYRSFRQRLHNFYRKVFLGDKKFKESLKKDYIFWKQDSLLNSFDNYDYALVIRADIFRKDFISSVSHKSNLSIGFHFDGISRDIEILDYISFFDKFYVFDKDDILKYPSKRLLYSTNFYFEPHIFTDSKVLIDSYDVYYVSTFNESRLSYLIELHKYLHEIYDSVCFVVVLNEEMNVKIPSYVSENMTVQYELISFEEQLKYISESKVIIDLVLEDHNGFSFRIFEGLCFNKKVITTNVTVLEADFYHPNNYFILDHNNYSDIESFLSLH